MKNIPSAVRTYLRSPARIAGLLYLFAALLSCASWGIVLFSSAHPGLSASASAWQVLSEMFSAQNPARLWVIWFAVQPMLCTALCVAYLRMNLCHSRRLARVLFIFALGLGLLSFAYTHWSLALFTALPCYWGYRCAYPNA